MTEEICRWRCAVGRRLRRNRSRGWQRPGKYVTTQRNADAGSSSSSPAGYRGDAAPNSLGKSFRSVLEPINDRLQGESSFGMIIVEAIEVL